MFMATTPTHRNTVIKSHMKQALCYPTAILPSVIGNFENPLPIRSADWHLYFFLLYGGWVLEKTKQNKTTRVCGQILEYLYLVVFTCICMWNEHLEQSANTVKTLISSSKS